MKNNGNPMQSAHDAPRCGAFARTTGGPCQAPAMANGRCRMHGGRSTGRPPIHGRYSKVTIARQREIFDLLREINQLLTMIP